MKTDRSRKFQKGLFLTVTVGLVVFGLARWSQAADFRLASSGNQVEVGDTFSVSVQVASPDQAVNAVHGVITFPTDRLQVVSVSKSGSIVNLWIKEPTFSNLSGQITFEGAILNPGFTGAVGRVLTVNFRAKTEGVASLAFSSGSILANDGQGTDVLNKLGSTNITVKTETVVEPKSKTVTPKDEEEVSTPSTKSSVDETPPTLTIDEVKSPAGDKARFIFSGQDKESGLDYYEVAVDDALALKINAGENINVYNTPSLSAGWHTLVVSAFDHAGNRAQERLEFKVARPISGSLLVDWGGSLVTLLSVAVPLIGLILILLIILLSGWRRLAALKIGLRREISDMELKLTETFEFIKTDLQEQMELLERAKKRRTLTAVEKKLLRTIKTDLNEAAKLLKKEINDIEAQIK